MKKRCTTASPNFRNKPGMARGKECRGKNPTSTSRLVWMAGANAFGSTRMVRFGFDQTINISKRVRARTLRGWNWSRRKLRSNLENNRGQRLARWKKEDFLFASQRGKPKAGA